MRTNQALIHHLMDRVAARIEDLEITQARAAELAGVAPARISEIANHRGEFGIDNLCSILARLGVTVDFTVNTVVVKPVPRG